MTLTDEPTAPGFTLDHIGMVVADLDAAVSFYTDVFGFSVVSREADTRVDDVAIGLPGESVRLRGAILRDTASNLLEIHQYLEPTGTAASGWDGFCRKVVSDRLVQLAKLCICSVDRSSAS